MVYVIGHSLGGAIAALKVILIDKKNNKNNNEDDDKKSTANIHMLLLSIVSSQVS